MAEDDKRSSSGPLTRLKARTSSSVGAESTAAATISGSVSSTSSTEQNGTSEPPTSEPADVNRPNIETKKELRTRTAVLLLLLIFLSSSLLMFIVWSTFPEVSEMEKEQLKFPNSIEETKALGNILSRYKEQYFAQVYGGFICTYIFLQTFAIPGSIFLSIISGFLFSFPLALFSVCFCSATGASFCYLLSYLVGRRLVMIYLPDRAQQWSAKVEKHRGNLLSYILFLRITPFLPNWFINIVSPVIGVPLLPFWCGSFFGVAPPSFVFIQAGTTLQQLSSTMDPITVESVALLVVFALLSLVPILLKDKLKSKFE